MLIAQWQGEIEFLKQELTDEIATRKGTSEMTVPNHICINNLEAKRSRLIEIEKNLRIEKYKLVFIGALGEGKTTAICHLFNLIGDFKVSKPIGGKIRSVTETQELLATGSGRTTICEVIIEAAQKTRIEIEPYTAEQMEKIIIEFCESLSDTENIQGEQKVMISKEIATAIRNIIDLNIVSRTITEGDKKQPLRIDKAKEKLESSGLEGLKELAFRNADLASRTQTRIEFDGQDDERTWIKRTFASINNAELKNFAIPKKIYVYVSEDILSGSNLSQFQAVVDTKGLDENPIRKDLQEYIDNQDTICLFATNFKDAPETSIRELMRYYLTSKSRDFHHRFVTFVITHQGDTEKVNGGDGTWELGTEIRREDIQGAFKNLNLEFFPENILFYDALRCYSTQITKLNTDLFSEEDVQSDRDACIQGIVNVIERRQQKIWLKEVEAIKTSFQKIKEGETLVEDEIEAIENAIQKIKILRDLGQRVPSFVYGEFIDNYVSYYKNNYRAWNTKHAINRRFGIYDARNIDIYYDARIVAEGRSEDEMLKKFTKEAKQNLEDILNELKSANEALETFIPELINQLDTFYDDFIDQVGLDIEEFLYNEKLSPQSTDSDFWIALINEKGKQRTKGETYTDNVCKTFERELEADENLNVFLQKKAEKSWAELVGKILHFFGEA
jgi:hypothetical protein